MKKDEIKFKCVKNTNGCWSGSVKLSNGSKEFIITVAAAPEAKNRSAKPLIKEILEERVAEFKAEHPDYSLVVETNE